MEVSVEEVFGILLHLQSVRIRLH